MLQETTAMVTTFAPTRCGIARFSSSLIDALCGRGRLVGVFRLVQRGERASADPRVVLEFDPGSPLSVERARFVLKRYLAVIVQHEFGIFGPDDGASVIPLISHLGIPVVAVLHTVPLHPSVRQRRIISDLAHKTALLVVPSHAARVALEDVFEIDASQVAVIPHGSNCKPVEVTSGARYRLLTWGLLGPGKGIERAITAISALRNLDPQPRYRVVGQTHPNVVRRQGYSYRESLERLVAQLDLHPMVEFDDSYKSEAELYHALAEADVIVIPYDNDEQICSGVLTDAVTAGKPVVATNFPHARELLSSGAGLVVDHSNPTELIEALRTLLNNDIAYRRAAEQARYQARRLSWSEVSRRYDDVIDRLTTSLAVG